MSIEKITVRILGDAQTERDIVLADARDRSRAVIAEAEKKAEQRLAEAKRKGEEEKEKIITRRKSVAEIDSRKVFLAKKQEMIELCFDRAIEEIIGMPQDAYVALLAELGRVAGVREGMLTFNEKEKHSIADKVCGALNENIESGRFTVNAQTGKMRGGYLLTTGNATVNNTVEALVSEAKTELTAEAAKLLFSEE